MSLLNIAIRGDLEQYQRDEIALTRQANLYALRVGSEQLRAKLESDTGASLGSRLAKTWKARVFANSGQSPAALVYTKAPGIISSFMAETVILPRKGKYLAVPTGFNRAGGRKGGKARITPKDMIASGQAFTRPRKAGPGLIWFLTVGKAETRSSRIKDGKLILGKIRQIAIAGGQVQVGRYGRRTRDILAARAVPMFVLLPSVRHAKRLDPEVAAERLRDRLPDLIAEGYSFYDRTPRS